jgi:hypothetical protein
VGRNTFDGASVIDNPVADLEQAKLELIRAKMLEKLHEKELDRRSDLLMLIIRIHSESLLHRGLSEPLGHIREFPAKESGLLDKESSSMFNEINRDDPIYPRARIDRQSHA